MLTIKTWQRFLFSLIMSICLFTSICLGISNVHIYDQIQLLTADEISNLNNRIIAIGDTYQVDIGIVTTNDLGNKSLVAYADDFYDDNDYGYGNDRTGLLLLIDMGGRNIHISTSGKCITLFNDARIAQMISDVASHLKNANYNSACNIFIDDIKSTLIAINSSNSNTNTNPNTSTTQNHTQIRHSTSYGISNSKLSLSTVVGICVLISLVISATVYLCIKRSYHHPAYHRPPTLPESNSVHYTAKRDNFVGSHTTKVRIKKDPPPSSGGGSSIHTSSSGRSHGGGSGSF